MNQGQNQTENKPVETKPKSKIKLARWFWVVAGIAVLAIAITLILALTRGKTASDGSAVKTQPDTADEVKIKQYLSSLRGDIVRYGESKQTYVGWAPGEHTAAEVKKMGSELKTQGLAEKTYIIFAKMPSSKLTFCMDAANFTGEIKSLMPWSKTCK